MRALVVGCGSWGTAFAGVLARRGHDVVLGCRDAAAATRIAGERRNDRYLPGVALEAAVRPEPLELARHSAEADLIALAVPSRAFAAVAAGLRASSSALCVSLTKGLEPSSSRLLLDVLCERAGIDEQRVAVLSGPNHAEEIGMGQPAASVVASRSLETARTLQRAIGGGMLRVYASTDVVGLQLCGAAKNVIALAAGACDGLGFGDNAKAALITRGLAEMARLGAGSGADPRTYAGLAGMGDLVATCTSRHSRNRAAGELLARGVPPAEIERSVGMTVEGLATAPAICALARSRGIELPISEGICAVLSGTPLPEALLQLLQREQVDEF